MKISNQNKRRLVNAIEFLLSFVFVATMFCVFCTDCGLLRKLSNIEQEHNHSDYFYSEEIEQTNFSPVEINTTLHNAAAFISNPVTYLENHHLFEDKNPEFAFRHRSFIRDINDLTVLGRIIINEAGSGQGRAFIHNIFPDASSDLSSRFELFSDEQECVAVVALNQCSIERARSVSTRSPAVALRAFPSRPTIIDLDALWHSGSAYDGMRRCMTRISSRWSPEFVDLSGPNKGFENEERYYMGLAVAYSVAVLNRFPSQCGEYTNYFSPVSMPNVDSPVVDNRYECNSDENYRESYGVRETMRESSSGRYFLCDRSEGFLYTYSATTHSRYIPGLGHRMIPDFATADWVECDYSYEDPNLSISNTRFTFCTNTRYSNHL